MINYIIGKDIEEKLLSNKRIIKLKFEEFNNSLDKKLLENNSICIRTDDKYIAQDFYFIFNKHKLLFKSIKQKNDKLKYPKKLELDMDINNQHIFDNNKFYCINYNKKTNMNNYLLLGLLIFIIISFCLFPLWPLGMKYLIWYILLGILLFLVRILNYVHILIIFCK